MARQLHKYTFGDGVAAGELAETLLLAVVTVECLHGESRVRLDCHYCLGATGACVIDASNDVGRDLNRVFTGLITREFGQGAFKVESIIIDKLPIDCAGQGRQQEAGR